MNKDTAIEKLKNMVPELADTKLIQQAWHYSILKLVDMVADLTKRLDGFYRAVESKDIRWLELHPAKVLEDKFGNLHLIPAGSIEVYHNPHSHESGVGKNEDMVIVPEDTFRVILNLCPEAVRKSGDQDCAIRVGSVVFVKG